MSTRSFILLALFALGWITSAEAWGLRGFASYPVVVFGLASFVGVPLWLFIEPFIPVKETESAS